MWMRACAAVPVTVEWGSFEECAADSVRRHVHDIAVSGVQLRRHLRPCMVCLQGSQAMGREQRAVIIGMRTKIRSRHNARPGDQPEVPARWPCWVHLDTANHDASSQILAPQEIARSRAGYL